MMQNFVDLKRGFPGFQLLVHRIILLWVGSNRLRLALSSVVGEICILGDLAEPNIDLAPSIKLMDGTEGLKECFLGDLFRHMLVPGQGQRVLIHILKIKSVDFFELGHFLTTFHL